MKAGRILLIAVIVLLAVGVLPSVGSAIASTGSAAPADVPETIFTDSDGAIYNLALKDNLLYYHSPCGGELDPLRSRLRSVPSEGGTVHDLYFPVTCQSNHVVSKNVALDSNYVYWLTGDYKVVRLPRGATPSDTPQLITTMATTNILYDWITVDSTQVYWNEGSVLYRAPKGGGVSTWVWDYSSNHGSGSISRVTADGNGGVYLLYNNTIFRDRITDTEVNVSPNGLGQGFTLGNGKVYWSEKDASTSTVYLKSAPVLTPSSTTLLTTISGTGNPTIPLLAVDSANLFWHEARSGIGPLQRMPNTGGTVSPLVSSMSLPNALVSNGLHVFWNDYTNIYRLSTAATAVTLDLAGNQQPLEVIQDVQNGTGTVTQMVRGKETFVRFYGRILSSSAGLTSISNMRPPAVLHGFRGATELPGSPLMPINITNPIGNSAADRTQYNSSYWFRLPADWVSGTITLRGEINPNRSYVETNYANNTSQTSVTFAAKSPICIDLVPVDTVRGSTIASYDPTRGDDLFFARAKTLLPTNDLRVFYRGGPLLEKPRWYLWDSDPFSLTTSDDDSSWLIFWSNARYLFSSSPSGCSATNAQTARVTMAPDPIPQPNDPNSRAVNGKQGGNSLLFFNFSYAYGGFSSNVPGGGTTLAHEIGHFFGRRHVNCPSSGPNEPSGTDSGYPYPVCQIDNAGPNSNIGYDWETNQLLLPANTGDLMSYAHALPTPEPRWPSDYTWRAIYNALGANPLGAPVPQKPAGGSATLVVTGVFSSTGAYVGHAYQVSGALETEVTNNIVASTQQTTTYEVRIYDSLNNVIANTLLRVFDIEDDSGNPSPLGFMNVLYYSASIVPARVAVVRLADNAVMGSVSAGANPPTVSITNPIGGSYSTSVNVQWSGNDIDGDTVLYTVRYSPDNGTSWIALATAVRGNQLTVPLNNGLPGGSQALVQVLATDGIHTAIATSVPFNVPLHAPQAAIYDSGYNLLNTVMITTAQQSDIVVLHADAYDAEDGPLSGAALQWNVTGPLAQSGSGDQLTLFNLPPGTYTVQLTATDSNAQSATTTTTVVIAPKHIFSGATPTLDGLCTDAGYNNELDPITLRYTGVISTAQVHFARGGDSAVWACFSGLQIGSRTDSFVGIRDDVDNSGGPWATVNDVGFFVGRDGVAFTARGDGVGGFTTDAVPDGLTAAVSQDTASGLWNAEMRIDESKLGGWNHLSKWKVSHYWRNFVGDDTVWPTNAFWNVPNTWGLVSLGQFSQSITFGTLADRLLSASPFDLSATASSGLPVSFASQTANVCTVLGNRVTLLKPGICTIRATQGGNATYPAATPVDRSFNVFTRLYLPLILR